MIIVCILIGSVIFLRGTVGAYRWRARARPGVDADCISRKLECTATSIVPCRRHAFTHTALYISQYTCYMKLYSTCELIASISIQVANGHNYKTATLLILGQAVNIYCWLSQCPCLLIKLFKNLFDMTFLIGVAI